MKAILLVPLLGLVGGAAAFAADAAPSLNSSTSVLGKLFGVSFNTTPNTAQNGLTATLNATILGSQKSLVQAAVAPTVDFGQGQLQVYVTGVQVGSAIGAFEQGKWSDTITIPPVNASGTIVTIPIGPLVIEVDGGYSLSGSLDTGLELDIPEGAAVNVDPSDIQATIDTTLQASGFITGSVSLVIIRGGVTGQLTAINGSVQTNAELYFGKTPPAFTATGQVGFLGGSISAFADYNSFFAGWQQFWSGQLFAWNGWCFNFTQGVQVAGKCAAQ